MNKSLRKILSVFLMLALLLGSVHTFDFGKTSNGTIVRAEAEQTATNAETENPPTKEPAKEPTKEPTQAPTKEPTQAPTKEPTEAPTQAPTKEPTEAPTQAPTQEPTQAPTKEPTQAPTSAPTEAPTQAPTKEPTKEPTQAPTEQPAAQPEEAEWTPGYARLQRDAAVYQRAQGSRKIGMLERGAILYAFERYEDTRQKCAFLVRGEDGGAEWIEGWIAEKHLEPMEASEKMLRELREQRDVQYFDRTRKLPLAFVRFEATPEATATSAPTATPEATATTAPTVTPEATATTAPTVTPEATATTAPTEAPEAPATTAPTETPEATATTAPEPAPAPTVSATAEPVIAVPPAYAQDGTENEPNSPDEALTDEPTATPTVTATPESTATPEPTATATAEPTAEPTATPESTATPVPTATATAEPTAAPTATAEPANLMRWAAPEACIVQGKLYAAPSQDAEVVAELDGFAELTGLGELEAADGRSWVLLRYEDREVYAPAARVERDVLLGMPFGAERAGGNAVEVSLKPAVDTPLKTGETGTLHLRIGVNDPNENKTATVRVRIPDNDVILPDFAATNQIVQGGLTLELVTEADGTRYIVVPDVPNGDAKTFNIKARYPNGTTGPKELAFTQEDITVTTNIEGNIVKETGGMQFIAAYYWVPVSKTVDKQELTVNAKRKIEGGPVTYLINATSYNSTGAGDVYTKEYTLTDELTLPEGLTFPEGELIQETHRESGMMILSIRKTDGSSVEIAQLSNMNHEQDAYGTPTFEASLTDNRTLQFTYTCKQPDGSNYSKALPNPGIRMQLYTENLAVGEALLTGETVHIANKADFEAAPCVNEYNEATLNSAEHKLEIDPKKIISGNHTSSANASTAITPPKPGYEVDKRLAAGSPTLDPATGILTLVYDLTVRNTGALDLNMRIADTLPEGLVFAEGQDYRGAVGDTVYTGQVNGKVVEWSNVSIPYQGTFIAQITAQTTENTPAGPLVNTLNAVDSKDKDGKRTTHTYDYALPNRAIELTKTHQTHAGADNTTLVRGGKVTYTVEVTNTGDLQTALNSVTDVCPEALEIDPESFTMNGEKLAANQVTIEEPTDGRQTIRFPEPEAPLPIGEKVVYTYTATLKSDTELKAGAALDNTATAQSGEMIATATDTVTLREPTTNLNAEKEVGDVRYENGRYAIEYRLRIANHGDAMKAGESITLTDRMEGELYPGEGFTVTLTKEDGTQETITPTVTPYQGANGENYEIKWTLSGMPGYNSMQEPPETVWTYSYTAYADVQAGANLHVKNMLLVGDEPSTGGVGGEVSLAPEPGIQKTITGVECAEYNTNASHRVAGKEEDKAALIHGGDVVTYRVVFANNGKVEMINTLLSDALPAGFINGNTYYDWKLKEDQSDVTEGRIESVEIGTEGFPEGTTLAWALKSGDSTGKKLVISATQEDAAAGSPVGFTFPAGAQVTLTLKLRYPSGETYNRYFLRYDETTDSYLAPSTSVTNRANLTGASRTGTTYNLNDTADVYPRPNAAAVQKTASASRLEPGDEVTFTFKGQGNGQWLTRGVLTDARLVEDLTPFKDHFELVGYNIGRFDGLIPVTANRGTYTFKLLDQAAVTRNFDATAQKVRLDTPIDLATLSGEDLKIVWDFGDVRGLWVSGAGTLDNNWPSITLRVKAEGAVSQSITNTIALQYDGTRYSHSTADVTVIAGERLTKSAVRDSADGTVTGGTINNANAGERLQVGDTVTFTLGYVNASSEAEAFTSENPLVLHDVMPTMGLAVYESEVEFEYIPASDAGEGQAELLSPTAMQITQADIDAASAKRTDFQIAGTLQPSDALRIRYKVKVGEGFRESAADNALNRKNSYAGGLPNPSGNLHQVHNYVHTTGAGDVTYSAETDYYYTPEANRLYFSKAVKNIGHMEVTTNANGSNRLSVNAGSYVTPGQRTLTQFGGAEQNFVKYTMVIYNDACSGENLVVDGITDRLPVNVQALTDTRGGKHYVLMRSFATSTGFFTDTASTTINELPADLSLTYFAPNIIGDILLPTTERAKLVWHEGMRVEIASQSARQVEFKLYNAGTGNTPLTLRPGEYVTFCYGVYLDRSADFSAYANSATLNVRPCADKSGWEALDSSYQDVFVTKQKTNDLSSTLFNVDSGERVNEEGTKFGAGVRIDIPSYRMSMTKVENGYYPVANKNDLTDDYMQTFLTTRAGKESERHTDWSNYGLYDIVEWKITVTNTSNVPIDDFIGIDFVPYPHKAVYFMDESGQTRFGITGDGRPFYGTVTDKNVPHTLGSFGQTSYEMKSAPFSLAAGASSTCYLYTVYDPAPDTPISYASVVNRAQVTTEGGKVFANITDANPMLNSDGRIIGATQSASVLTASSSSVTSYKTVSFGNQTASGNSANRTVTANERGDTVRYTLYVKNMDKQHDMRNVILIDSLPVPGDYGTVNLSAPRNSEFTVNLANNPNISVEVKSEDATEWTALKREPSFDLSAVGENEYLALFTPHDRHEGGNPVDVWQFESGQSHEHWYTSLKEGQRATSVLFYVPNALKANYEMRISFDCVIQDDAQLNQIAWNSFGYSYRPVTANTELTGSEPQIFAEPAKVGVKINTYYAPPELPSTGGKGTEPYALAGLALILLAAGSLTQRRRKRR